MTDWSASIEHLRRVDPVIKNVIDRVGPCTLSGNRDYFVRLCKAIFSQQISTKVAAVLFERFRATFPGRRPTPKLLLEMLQADSPLLNGIGISRPKRTYLRDLAEHFHGNKIPVRRLSKMSDDQVIDALVKVKGIGRWTAEMFLIFTLNRPDVLPVDDLGLQTSVRDVYKLPARPGAAELTKLAEPWRPHRTLATWYLWRHIECAAKDAKSNAEIAAKQKKADRLIAAVEVAAMDVAAADVIANVHVAVKAKKKLATAKSRAKQPRAGRKKPRVE